MWTDPDLKQFERFGRSYMVALKDCRDTSCRVDLGLFPNMLRSELHPVRASIEKVSKTKSVENLDLGTLAGVGLYRSIDNVVGGSPHHFCVSLEQRGRAYFSISNMC